MPRKKIKLSNTKVVIPARLNLTDLSKQCGYKADIIAIILHQLCVVADKREAADGWVPLKSQILQCFYRRPTPVLNGLEKAGIIEVERNAQGNKSYLSSECAKKMGVPPTCTRYRLRPDYQTDFVNHILTEKTAWKGFYRGVRKIEKEGEKLRKAAEVQNVQDELSLSTNNKEEIEGIDIKEIVNTALNPGRFVPKISESKTGHSVPLISPSEAARRAFGSSRVKNSAVKRGEILENNQRLSQSISVGSGSVLNYLSGGSRYSAKSISQRGESESDVGRSVPDWEEADVKGLRLASLASRYPSVASLFRDLSEKRISESDFATVYAFLKQRGIQQV
jgi:hypothetical protein